MGDSITEGTVVEIPLALGSWVEMDEVVCVLETDKVSVEVRAPMAGVLVDFLAAMDDVVEVGAPLFKLDPSGTPPAGGAPKAAAAAVPAVTPPPTAAAAPAKPAAAPAPKPAAAAAPAAAAVSRGSGDGGYSSSVLSGSSAVYVDSMFASWKHDPSSVHSSWNAYFSQVDAGVDAAAAFTAPPTLSGVGVPAVGSSAGGLGGRDSGDTAKTMHLIAAYQRRGHEMAILDPLGLTEMKPVKDLDPAIYGFDLERDWERGLNLGGSLVGAVQGLMGNADVNNDGETTLHELVDFLQQTYCGSIGVEVRRDKDREAEVECTRAR
jgi:hypothetical protein